MEGLAEFLSDAQELLDSVETDILSLEQDPDNETSLNSIFRAFHTIKGTSGFFNLDGIASLTHRLENLLSLIRDHKKSATGSVISVILQGVDITREMVTRVAVTGFDEETIALSKGEKLFLKVLEDEIESETPADVLSRSRRLMMELAEIIEEAEKRGIVLDKLALFTELVDIVKGLKDVIENSAPDITVIKKGREAKFNCVLEDKDYKKWVEDIFSLIDLTRTGSLPDDAGRIWKDAYHELNETAAVQPEANDLLQELSRYWNFLCDPLMRGEGEMLEMFRDTYIKFLQLVFGPEGASENKQEEKAEPQPVVNGEKKQQKLTQKTIRINQDKLDEFLRYVGDLVICKNTFDYLYENLRQAETFPGQEKICTKYKHTVGHMDSLITSLQYSAVSVRLIPVRSLFEKYKRMVRDLSGSLNKRIQLELGGVNTEFDKNILEKIDQPLVHILRNCIDHGIETPEERVRSGKEEKGIIKLLAGSQEGEGWIKVIDDGKGIDPDKVRAAAVKKGIINGEEAKNLSYKEALRLIFRPGFSTNEEVSTVSGRGVGMDVVTSTFQELGGKAILKSVQGKGTEVICHFPLTETLITTDAMKVLAGKAVYLLSINEIVEIVTIAPSEIKNRSDTPVFLIRDEVIELRSIVSCIEDKNRLDIAGIQPDALLTVIVIKTRDRKLGLWVDTLLNIEKIVVREFDKNDYYKKIRFFKGTAILGDGSVSLIIDTQKLT